MWFENLCVRACACACVVKSVNERICVGHFLNPADNLLIKRVKDSTPFHKNVVQPPTKAHTCTHIHTQTYGNHTGGAPVPQEQYTALYEAMGS